MWSLKKGTEHTMLPETQTGDFINLFTGNSQAPSREAVHQPLVTGLTYYKHKRRISSGSQTVGNDFLQASIYCHIAMVHVPSASMGLRGVGDQSSEVRTEGAEGN